jgi:hypothetical protein
MSRLAAITYPISRLFAEVDDDSINLTIHLEQSAKNTTCILGYPSTTLSSCPFILWVE